MGYEKARKIVPLIFAEHPHQGGIEPKFLG
jgi:hypothetical protein